MNWGWNIVVIAIPVSQLPKYSSSPADEDSIPRDACSVMIPRLHYLQHQSIKVKGSVLTRLLAISASAIFPRPPNVALVRCLMLSRGCLSLDQNLLYFFLPRLTHRLSSKLELRCLKRLASILNVCIFLFQVGRWNIFLSHGRLFFRVPVNPRKMDLS